MSACACVHVCMYVCKHVCRCVCTCVFVHVCRCVCMCVHLCECVHVYVSAFVCVGMCECVCTSVCMCGEWSSLTTWFDWESPRIHTFGHGSDPPWCHQPHTGGWGYGLNNKEQREREPNISNSVSLLPDCTQCEPLPHTPAVEPHTFRHSSSCSQLWWKQNPPSLGCSCQGFFFFQARRSNWHSVWHRFHTIFPEPSEKTVILFITRLIPSCNIYWALIYSLFNVEFGEPWPQIKFTLMNNVFQRNTYHSP